MTWMCTAHWLPWFPQFFPSFFLPFPASVYSSLLPAFSPCFCLFFLTSFFPSLLLHILPYFRLSCLACIYSSLLPSSLSRSHLFSLSSLPLYILPFFLFFVFAFLRTSFFTSLLHLFFLLSFIVSVYSSLLPSSLPSFFLSAFPSLISPYLPHDLILCYLWGSNTVTCRRRLLLMFHIVLSVAQDTSHSHVCCTKNPIHSSLVPHIAPLRALNAYVISRNPSVCGLNVKLPFSRRSMYDLTCHHFPLFHLSVLY